MNSLSITLIPGLNGGASLASAHGGGVDGQGGHNNRSAGNYHFHRGPLDGRTFASKEERPRCSRHIRLGRPMKRVLIPIDPLNPCSLT